MNKKDTTQTEKITREELQTIARDLLDRLDREDQGLCIYGRFEERIRISHFIALKMSRENCLDMLLEIMEETGIHPTQVLIHKIQRSSEEE